jgi:predicted nuclease of predicted toxin-antitoxin system
VKLLFDENLSRRLPARLADLFPGSSYVSEVHLLQAKDSEVWEYARIAEFLGDPDRAVLILRP